MFLLLAHDALALLLTTQFVACRVYLSHRQRPWRHQNYTHPAITAAYQAADPSATHLRTSLSVGYEGEPQRRTRASTKGRWNQALACHCVDADSTLDMVGSERGAFHRKSLKKA
ncbi:MAG TPA: hypothetical protein VGE88_07405 [Lysobacter sp.]